MSNQKTIGTRKKNKSQENVLSKKTSFSVFDMLYSKFGFDVLSKLFIGNIHLNFKSEENKALKQKNSDDFSKKVFRQLDIELNTIYLRKELFIWCLLQTNNPENKNPFLPKEISNEKDVNIIISHYYQQRARALNVTLTKSQVDKKIKDVLNSFNLNLFTKVNKHHTPPLLAEDLGNRYKLVKTKGPFDIQSQQDLIHLTLINDKPRKDSLFDTLPTQELLIYYHIKAFDDVIFITLQEEFEKKIFNQFEKTYIGKSNNLFSSIFKLNAYYRDSGMVNFFMDPFIINDPKLKKLQSKTIELIASPLTNNNRPYYGLFKEEEYFGSKGLYFNAKVKSGIYTLKLPPSYLFIKDALLKIKKWLSSIKKLTLLVWFPRFKDVSDQHEVKFQNKKSKKYMKELSINRFTIENLLPQLEQSKYRKSIFYYNHNKKANKQDYLYKIFVLST